MFVHSVLLKHWRVIYLFICHITCVCKDLLKPPVTVGVRRYGRVSWYWIASSTFTNDGRSTFCRPSCSQY